MTMNRIQDFDVGSVSQASNLPSAVSQETETKCSSVAKASMAILLGLVAVAGFCLASSAFFSPDLLNMSSAARFATGLAVSLLFVGGSAATIPLSDNHRISMGQSSRESAHLIRHLPD